MRRQPARSAPPRLVEEMRGGGSCRPEEKPGGDARGAGVLIKIIKVLIKKKRSQAVRETNTCTTQNRPAQPGIRSWLRLLMSSRPYTHCHSHASQICENRSMFTPYKAGSSQLFSRGT